MKHLWLIIFLSATARASTVNNHACYLSGSSTACFQSVNVASGGTGDTSFTSNAVVVGNGTGALNIVTNNATATNEFLTQSSSGAPAWAAILAADVPSLAASKITSGTLATARGGTNADSSAFTGVVKTSSGTWSAATLVNADVDAAAAIAGSKLQIVTASNAGVLSTGADTAAGVKTFQDGVVAGTTSANIVSLTAQNSSTASPVATFKNNSTSASADGEQALNIIKGTTNNTAGGSGNVFIQFLINLGTTNSGFIATNGANAAAFFSGSDQRLKKNIVNLPSALPQIMALRPVQFNWKEDGTIGRGFIAQEIYKVLPQFVSKTDSGIGDSIPAGVRPWAITESGMVPYLVKAIQEQQAEIAALQAQLGSK